MSSATGLVAENFNVVTYNTNMETQEKTFIEWLEDEIEGRGWTLRELGRRSDLTHVAISNVLNGARNPGTEFCLKIARALKVPPELVFRRAGLLPDIEGVEERLFQRLRTYIAELSPERREELLRYVIFLYQLEVDKEGDPKSEEDKTA